jgi:hypothetical protein
MADGFDDPAHCDTSYPFFTGASCLLIVHRLFGVSSETTLIELEEWRIATALGAGFGGGKAAIALKGLLAKAMCRPWNQALPLP